MAEERARAPRTPRRQPPPAGSVGTATRRRPGREPQLTRTRPGGVVAATTGFLGISSARRAAILAIVVCALALSVAVPLRNYVTLRQELAAVSQRQQDLAAEVARLTEERDRLADPAEIEALARTRLGYVRPGEVPYVVQLPTPPEEPAGNGEDRSAWFAVLWREITAGAP
ncbi:Cell division protein FtsB [Pseudonocardia thermophila]|uniref:Cell division protein FtsB n=1 Tax=Pseudonocardia thermophila TaxID=1848 RepID=A0A1M6XCS5_PSETH|nr:septum formation initiator family protein [Pseudonocardia thermophila]SHL03679.1 Cell division protein FtsB [Pseudonocardia thermophila]